MTKSIRSYKDLLEEKERLQLLLEVQKQAIRTDVQELKESLAPVKSAISFVGKFVTRDGNNFILNAGANSLINAVVKNFILSKTGWFTKFIVPFLLKNYSSHLISEKKGNIMKKLFSWIGKKRKNGKEVVDDE